VGPVSTPTSSPASCNFPSGDLQVHRCRRVVSATVRDFVLYLTIIVNVLSMFALVAGILMHSGRGGGLSDMFGGGGGAALGSTAAERNLNRITLVLALVWFFTVVALGFLLQS
jgi:preprotein translocase subunit SecG